MSEKFQQMVVNIVDVLVSENIEGSDGDDAWTDFKNDLVKSIMDAAKVAFSEPLFVQKKSKGGSPKGDNKVNSYTQWVKGVTRIRKGLVSGNDKVTLGDHFTKKTTISATKYYDNSDSLGLDGTVMTVKDLLDTLKAHPELSNEKDLSITAIAWGLIPAERRQELSKVYAS
jgi:hypothetical protein